MSRWGGLVVLVVVLLSPLAQAQAPPSPPAEAADPFPAPPIGNCSAQMLENPNDCCWPGQQWSKYLEVCVGTPRCPEGYRAVGETCKPPCAGGQVDTVDTAGHCCWPGQAWSKLRNACVGIPRCPPDRTASGEDCATGSAPVEERIGEPAAPRGTPVYFIAADSVTRYHLRINDERREQACATPCRLSLRPGTVRLTVGDPGSFRRTLVVPEAGAQVRLSHLNVGRLAAGVLFVGLAALGIITGAWAINSDHVVAGGTVLVGGLVAGAIGIPLLVGAGRDSAVTFPY